MTRRKANGEGSIYRRTDGRWCAEVTVSSEGKRVRRFLYGRTQAAVRERLQQARQDRRNGVTPTPERLTVGEYLDGWLRSVKPTVRSTTYSFYAIVVRIHLAPTLGHIALGKLTPQHVRDLLTERLGTGLSPRTVQAVHACLRQALGQAQRDDMVTRNVAALASPPRQVRAEIHPLDPVQARALVEAAKGDRLEALYVVAVALGLRQGEALGLSWSDVDLDAGTLTVRRSLQRVPKIARTGERFALVEPKTSHSRRTIRMPGLVVSGLREHRVRQLEERLAAGVGWQDLDLVFTTTIGTPIDARNLTRAFVALLQRAGLPRVRFHDLRHSAATLLLAQGVSARVVMDLLGHSTIGMTLGTYSHVLPDMQREAADQMDAVLAVRRPEVSIVPSN